MWRGFKNSTIIVLVMLPVFCGAQNNQGLLYNLKQNWVQYDIEAESFMPAISQSSGKTISFLLEGEEFRGRTLFISNSNLVHLFYNQILLNEFNPGQHYVNIDSLITFLNVKSPLLTLYGKNVRSNLSTLIVDDTFIPSATNLDETQFREKSYSSFFIIGSILLLLGLALIKYNSHDLFSQYANVSRAFNFTTIDEIIYKGSFFINPSVQLVGWMSFSAAFVFYYLAITLNIDFLVIGWVSQNSVLFHFVQLLVLTVGFFILYIIRYVLISAMASVFDLSSIRNIHFATHLRLTFYLLLALQALITLTYFAVVPINTLVILIISLTALFLIIVLIGVRLSFIVRHPFIQIFLYLCGTEIFLFVFVFMLVVG